MWAWQVNPVLALEPQETNKVQPISEPSENWVMSRDWIDPVDAERLYKKQQQKKVYTKVYTKPISYNPCSCVSYARYIRGVDVGPIGVARNHPVNSQTPVVGAYIITYESWAGHMGIVTAITDGYIEIKEANYSRCQVTTGRLLPINSPLIKGYYH